RYCRTESLASQSLEPAVARRDRHDGDLQPTIYLDALHRAAQSEIRYDACRIAVDVLVVDRPANVVFTVPGVSGRPFRAAPTYLCGGATVGRKLGRIRSSRQYLAFVPDLRRDWRLRHRHHLRRHYWADGALVSGSARACGGSRCRGLRFRRDLHELSDRQHE